MNICLPEHPVSLLYYESIKMDNPRWGKKPNCTERHSSTLLSIDELPRGKCIVTHDLDRNRCKLSGAEYAFPVKNIFYKRFRFLCPLGKEQKLPQMLNISAYLILT